MSLIDAIERVTGLDLDGDGTVGGDVLAEVIPPTAPLRACGLFSDIDAKGTRRRTRQLPVRAALGVQVYHHPTRDPRPLRRARINTGKCVKSETEGPLLSVAPLNAD